MLTMHRFTADEYLAFERSSELRHEFVDGVIYDRAVSNEPHCMICTNLLIGLGPCVKQRGGFVFTSAMRIQMRDASFYAYPDVVIGEKPELADRHQDTLLNPRILIEVFSPSTEDYDRHEKPSRYRRIPSLEEYLLIAQEHVCIEHIRTSETSWRLEEILDLN